MFKDNIFKKVNKVVCLFATLYSLLSPWDSPGKNTGVGCHFLIQGIFPTQGANPALLCLLHWQVDFFYHQSVQSLSRVWLCATPWNATRQASLSITNSRRLLNSCPLKQWCYPTISTSVITFTSLLPSFWASGSFQISQFFISGGQSIGVSASTLFLPMNIQGWFPLG